MTTIRWKRFFVESGLPTDIADNYAVIFVENRIRFDMLEELNREILNDMGIKKMGDVISILRHSKAVYSSTYREKLFANDESEEQVERDKSSKVKADSTISNETSSGKRQSSSIVDHHHQQQLQSENNRRRVVLPAKQQKPATPVREIVMPKHSSREEVRIRQPRPSQTIAEDIKPDRVFSEPKIIRNVTGLNLPSASSVCRKRIEPPTEVEEVDVPKPKTIKAVSPLLTQRPSSSSSSSIVSSQPTSIANRMIVQNRTEQSRVSNFSRHIQRAISSNQPNQPQQQQQLQPISTKPVTTKPLLLRPTSQHLTVAGSNSQKLPVRSRLTLKPNQSSPVVKIPDSTSTLPVKARLGVSVKPVKDRLGLKSTLNSRTPVFSRTALDDNAHGSSVFSRLGAK